MLAGAVAAPDTGGTQDPGALGRAGTTAIENHSFGEALDAFTRAAALQPDDASHCFGAGVAAFMLGQTDLAQDRFECALALNPAYLQAAEWLGDLHYRAGRLNEAIAIYDAAWRHSPHARGIVEQLALWRKERDLLSRFREVRTKRFTVLFEPMTREGLACEVVDRLNAAYARVGATLGVYPSQPITVVLYTRAQYTQITKLAAWSVAAFDGRILVPVSETLMERGELDRVLSHEYVHALAAMLGGRTAPAWLSEGLATALEPVVAEDAQRTRAPVGAGPALSDLHAGFVRLSRRDAEAAYASAEEAVRRLIQHRGAAAVVALLEDLGRGTPFADAFRRRFEMRYDDFAARAARN